MKKFVKLYLIIGIVCIVVGGGLSIAAAVLGGDLNVFFHLERMIEAVGEKLGELAGLVCYIIPYWL